LITIDGDFDNKATAGSADPPSISNNFTFKKINSQQVHDYLNKNQMLPNGEFVDNGFEPFEISLLMQQIHSELVSLQYKQESAFLDFFNYGLVKLTENVALQHFLAHPYYYIPSSKYKLSESIKKTLPDLFVPNSDFVINLEEINRLLLQNITKYEFELFKSQYVFMVKKSLSSGLRHANVIEAQTTKQGRFYCHITALYILYKQLSETNILQITI